jgi:hypothetical protein
VSVAGRRPAPAVGHERSTPPRLARARDLTTSSG